MGLDQVAPMKISVLRATVLAAVCSFTAPAQVSVKWEELNAIDFVKAIERAQGVCVLPIGIIEKHGPHLPMGTDLINVRYISHHAA